MQTKRNKLLLCRSIFAFQTKGNNSFEACVWKHLVYINKIKYQTNFEQNEIKAVVWVKISALAPRGSLSTCPSTLSTAMHLPSDSVRISWLLGASMRQQHNGSSSMTSVSMVPGPSDRPTEPKKQPVSVSCPACEVWGGAGRRGEVEIQLTYGHI